MPLLSDVGIPGGGDPDGPRFQPNFRVLEYKPAAHRAAALGLFVSLALAVAFASRGILGLVAASAVFVVLFAVLRWALGQEKGWARPLGITVYGAVAALMALSSIVSFWVLWQQEGGSLAVIAVNSLIWFAGALAFVLFPKRWFSRT